MKHQQMLAVAAVLFQLPSLAEATNPVVSNISAAQRAGTQLVDITYDVTADTPTVWVLLTISSDGGTTFSVPAVTISGAVGSGIATGTGKVITWNAAADWNKQYSTKMCFKVTADDQFVNIPAGNFQMGNAMAEDKDIADAPVRTVTVSTFYMGVNLATCGEWATVRNWGLANGYTDLSIGAGKAANHPVQTITWYDVVKWCNARSEMDGLTPCYTLSGAVYRTTNSDAVVCNWSVNGYRLPTEAEWEKAARGGLIGKRFPWGDTISESQANYLPYNYNSIAIGLGGGPPFTTPGGSYPANGYGLYDMAGNVFELCWDWYGAYAAGSQTNPLGASSGTSRVFRGGYWYYNGSACRVASRTSSGYPIYGGYNGIGFRVARSLLP